MTDAAADFENVRPRLFGIAYRTLGGVADAEDIVQDVWVRWQSTDRDQVRDHVAFLVTITARLALNAAMSARVRREICLGRWMPEPIRTSDDPTLRAERTEALECGVALLLERLTPVERAVFVLREAFEYPFREIAATLDISEVNARQIARRARKHLTAQRHEPCDPDQRDRLLRALLVAARCGELACLKQQLAQDVATQFVPAEPTVRALGA